MAESVARLAHSSRPADLAAMFKQVCGDFWYFVLMAYCKLRRGEVWAARQAFHSEAMQHPHLLLRIESGNLDRWEGSSPALDAERSLRPERLAGLDRCIPAPDSARLHAALRGAAELGRDVSWSVAAEHSWFWPDQLADRILSLLAASAE
ncbi:MAG: hypothetical protein ACR2PL_18465 [Dehalococcoidia bacterium]